MRFHRLRFDGRAWSPSESLGSVWSRPKRFYGVKLRRTDSSTLTNSPEIRVLVGVPRGGRKCSSGLAVNLPVPLHDRYGNGVLERGTMQNVRGDVIGQNQSMRDK